MGSRKLKNSILLLLFFAADHALAAGPVIEVPVQATCQEHIASEPRVTAQDWPKRARGREISAYVVISYSLDGSGKAMSPTVTDSKPKGLFEESTLGILERTEFVQGAKAPSCTYVRTYGSVKRAER
ncbi:energy transducer TonB [Pseudoxanthomonas mexicana]|uniref:energy transducer TonB n=1 Tax=Pseudoxanthomonas mexicana TaxID=128785 RepID=UPI0009F98B73